MEEIELTIKIRGLNQELMRERFEIDDSDTVEEYLADLFSDRMGDKLKRVMDEMDVEWSGYVSRWR